MAVDIVELHSPMQAQTAIESEPEAEPPPPQNWPADILYLTRPAHSPNLGPEQLQHLTTRPPQVQTHAIKLPTQSPSPHVSIRPITNPDHPAYLQYGLFALLHLPPDSLIIPYLGYVHSNDPTDIDITSDYDLSLDRAAGISVDAAKMGNEARMCNDYRGVPVTSLSKRRGGGRRHDPSKTEPNAEFRDVWFQHGNGRGELGIGIFVRGAGKSGRFKAGIREGEEILVNYGKGFWNARREETPAGSDKVSSNDVN